LATEIYAFLVVHLVGGVAGLASTLYLKPRQARFVELTTNLYGFKMTKYQGKIPINNFIFI
jgi:ammonia channel protein AmtB